MNRRRLGHRTLAVLAAAVLAGAAMPASAAPDDRIQVLAKFRSLGPIYVDPGARLLYHIATENTSSGGLGSSVKIMDLDTLQQKSAADFDASLASFLVLPLRGAGAHVQGGLAAVDPIGHRLFYPYRDPITTLPHIAVIDGPSGTVSSRFPVPAPVGGPGGNFGIEAIDHDSTSDVLNLITVTPVLAESSAAASIFLQRVRATTGEILSATLLSQCESLFPSPKVMPVLGHKGEHVYAGCTAGASLGGTAQILKIKIGPSGPGEIKSIPAPLLPTSGIFDPVNERVYIVNTSKLLAVLDGVHEVWVGVAVPGNRPQLGMDPSIGRVYLCGQQGTGLFSTDAGVATPVPPGAAAPNFACRPDPSWALAADPVTKRIFIEMQTADGPVWAAAKDTLPAYQAPPPFDPDAGAQDIDEVAGKTETAMFAQGAGYGTRMVLIGGPLGLIDNTTIFVGPALREAIAYEIKLRFAEGSREVRFGKVGTAKMSDSGLEASAITADRDNRFQGDLESIRQHEDNPGHEHPSWPYQDVKCFAFGGETDQPSPAPRQGASATCDFSKKALEARAEAQRHELAGIVTVGESSSRVVSRRDPLLGSFAESTSVSRNINIANKVFIAEVRAVAKAWAKGRPGTARTSYERYFRGVKVLGADGSPLYECRTMQECVPDAVVTAINTALGPRIVATLPQPDSTFLNGTPKGTISSVRQDDWQQTEERVLFDKPVEDLTMAAFDIRVGANLLSTSGTIMQFAGTTASSGYRIFKLPESGLDASLIPPLSFGPFEDEVLSVNEAIGKSEPKTTLTKIVEKIKTGMRFIFGPGDDFRTVLASWALLLAPAYVGIRRRAFLKGIA